jgi:hypothetical protein
MRLRGACAAIFLAVAAGFFAPLPAAAQGFSTFDDFGAPRIDGTRWVGFADTVRFRLRPDGESNTWSNEAENPLTRHPRRSTANVTANRASSMASCSCSSTLSAAQIRTPTSRRGTVTPVAAHAPPCRAVGESEVRAVVSASIVGGGEAILARLVLERSSFGGDRIYGVLRRCPGDGQCAVVEDFDRVAFNRAWTLRDAHTLTIRHDAANGRVVFVVAGGGAETESRVLRPPAPDSTVVITGFGLRVETVPANCPVSAEAPAERVQVTMDARFDDVRVAAP